MRFAAVLTMLLTVACASGTPTTPGGPVDARVVLAPGQIAGVAEADLVVRFEGVTGDSRCPADAICIQGGDAIVHIVVLSSNVSTPFELHTGDLKPVKYRDVAIALENLSPYPFSSRTIAPGDYRATLRVTR